jgi:O-antigen/teichoic acid export membrane protein
MVDRLEHREGLRRRLTSGLGATALGPVVTALIQLGSVPILLHAWGASRYGDWLILSAIPSYLTLSDLGLGDASGSDMAMRLGAGDRDGALQTFQSSWVFVTAVSVAIMLLALPIVWWIPWQTWLKLSSISSRQAAEIISLLGAHIVVSQQDGIAESGFRSDGHFATGMFWITMLRLTEAVASTIVALLGGNLLAVAITYLIVRFVGTIGYISLLRHVSPWIHYGIRHARLKAIKLMAAPALGFMALPVGSAMSLQGLTLVIGARLGPLAVVSFSTLRTLSRLNLQLIGVIKNALWPELSRAFGAGDISLVRRLHRRACQASLALSASGGLFLWIFGPLIYRLWIGHNVSFNAACFHILLLVVLTNSLWDTSSVIPISMNGHSRIAANYVGAAAFSLILAWVLVGPFGLVGAAVALLATDGWMTGLVLRTALLQAQDTPKNFAVALLSIPNFALQPTPKIARGELPDLQ